MAFKYFADKKVDAAVVECGLGGRLDSTNIITPKLSVITQIAIDHTQYLGKTLSKIANEKLGIVKKGVDAVVSDNNNSLKQLFKKKINKKQFFYLDDFIKIRNSKITSVKNTFTFKIKPDLKIHLSTPLPGNYQTRNAACAILAVKLYLDSESKDLSIHAIQKGVSNIKTNTGYRGRIEIIKHKGKTYIFDISHNPAGIKSALQTMKNNKIDLIVFGMMSDKDYKTSVREILKYSDKIIFTKPLSHRALEPSILLNSAMKYPHKNKEFYLAGNLNKVINIVKGLNKNVKTVLFIGSFFLISDAIKALRLQNYFK
jgi:dihydrofolate synthase/folylpolyglutamate synthase